MLTDQVHLEHELAVSEVKRYTMTPTQPLSYLVGRERILAMRERYKKKTGAAFTLKRFHAASSRTARSRPASSSERCSSKQRPWRFPSREAGREAIPLSSRPGAAGREAIPLEFPSRAAGDGERSTLTSRPGRRDGKRSH